MARRRHDLDERREQLAAAGGRRGAGLVAPLRVHAECGLEPGERRRADPAGVEPPRAVLRRERAVGASWLRGENPLGSATSSRSGSRTKSAPDGSGPHSHFWRRRCRSRRRRGRPGSRPPTGRRRRAAAARRGAGAARDRACGPSSRGRARSRSAASAASRRRAARPRPPSVTTTCAPLAWSGPRRPKCSWSVVTTSSSAPSPRPATTIWQPRVVESVSATSSAEVPRTPAKPSRMRSRVSRAPRCTPCRSGPRPGLARAVPGPPRPRPAGAARSSRR